MQPLTMTPLAVEHVQKMLSKSPGSLGIRVHIERGGCNGFKFHFQPADATSEADHQFPITEDVSVVVDKKMYIFVEGSQIDFVPSPLSAEMGKMVLNNPQEKGSCGCGESFNV